jgi:hypothetical protein
MTRFQVQGTLGIGVSKYTYDVIVRNRRKHGSDYRRWPADVLHGILGYEPTGLIKGGISFSDFSESDVTEFREIYMNADLSEVQKYLALKKAFGIEKRTAQRYATQLGLTNRLQKSAEEKAAENRALGSGKYHLFTSAQNATPVNQNAWANILVYAEHIGAEIHVIPFRYKNPTSTFVEARNDWWDPLVRPYLNLARHEVCDNLLAACDVKVQPTAEFPLRGLHAISRGRTTLIGHPKMHMETCAVLPEQHRASLWTTGAVTEKNYTDSRAGKKGESHHQIGFTVVEVDGGDFHVRHVPCDAEGDFQDLSIQVVRGEVIESCTATGLVLGDLHIGEVDADKMGGTLALYNWLRPEKVVLHDVFNGHSVSHWDRKNPVLMYHKLIEGKASLKVELKEMLRYLAYMEQEMSGADLYVVRSNHDEWLDRYVASTEWKHDLTNAAEFANLLSVSLKKQVQLIPHLITEEFGRRYTCLSRNEVLDISGFNAGNHGDKGIGGSRGSALQYERIPGKQIVGHYHSSGRWNGVLVTGTSTVIPLPYQEGPDAAHHGDVLVYPNGQAVNILYHKGKFTTLLCEKNL